MATVRRNGQLSSCEPCRKSKLRCDHKSPTCDRCLQRGQPNHCVYHPAPLTRAPRPPVVARKGSERPKRRYTKNPATFRIDRNPSTTASSSTLVVSEKIGVNLYDQHVGQWAAMKKWPLTPGNLGLASSQDIFNESHDVFGEGSQYQDRNHLQDATATQHPPEELEKIQLGAQVLLQLNKIRWLQEIIELKNKVSTGWFFGPPLTRTLCAAIERIFDDAVQGSSDTQASLLSLSAEIFTNTTKRISIAETMTMPEYVSLVAARWETIGLLFAVLGTATFHIPDDNPVFACNPWKIDRNQLRSISVAVSEICCQFCNHSGFTSDPLCWLVTQQTVLLTLMAGKSDVRTWQKLGELSTITYAIGLHRPTSKLEEKCPFFLAELRKRAFACAYSLDKELATTLGLPPRICSRYCSIELPLDLSYEEIIAAPSEVERSLQCLDPSGWNTKGRLTLEVRLRIALLTSFMRENILELSMSHQTDDLLDRVNKMIEDSRKMQQSLPLFLRWDPSETDDLSVANESRSLTHLEFTYQEFLLYRIVLKRLDIKLQGLIDTSCEIISTLLNLATLRTRSAKRMQDVSWDLCYMGLPAAGILTTELRSKQSTATPQPVQSRSQMIQNLSIFVSYLKSFIEPPEGIYEVAQQGASIISKVLDQILSGDSVERVTRVSYTDFPDNGFGHENLDVCEDDIMPWFESIDWGDDSCLHFT